MTADDRNVRIDAIAAKALMLSVGESFAVPVSGGPEKADETLREIEQAIRRQYESGCGIVAGLAHPDELATRSIVTSRGAHIIIERLPDGSA